MSAYVGPKWRYVGLCRLMSAYVGLCRLMSAYVGLGLLAQFGKTECVLTCSHGGYCKLTQNRSNQTRDIAFWNVSSPSASKQRLSQLHNNHTKLLCLLISAIPPRRFCDVANQLESIAQICITELLASEGLRFSNYVFCRCSNNSIYKNAIPLGRNAWLFLDMIWSIITCRAWLRGPFPCHKWRY